MILVRWLVLLLLLGSAVCFAFYIGTGQRRYIDLGWRILRWTLGAAFVFFAVLILERVL
jgi:hypothetical protein